MTTSIKKMRPAYPRNSAKAIICRDGKLLLNKCVDPPTRRIFYTFPGGGQRIGESLVTTLARECREELGADIIAGELVMIRDFIRDSNKNPDTNYHITKPHQVEFYFTAELIGEPNLINAILDDVQITAEWVPISELSTIALYPESIVGCIDETGRYLGPLYLGNAD